MTDAEIRAAEILLVEDDPGDVKLSLAALEQAKIRNRISVVEDGVLAMEFLRRQGAYAQAPRPDLILLDLKLPRKDGLQVLAEIKADEDLRTIPVVVLTSSAAEKDVVRSYNLRANAYVTKPIDFDRFTAIVRSIEAFWVCVVALPPKPPATRTLGR